MLGMRFPRVVLLVQTYAFIKQNGDPKTADCIYATLHAGYAGRYRIFATWPGLAAPSLFSQRKVTSNVRPADLMR